MGEYRFGADPNNADTDGDGLTDGEEGTIHSTDLDNPDTDGDLIPGQWEVQNDRDPLTNDAALDPDVDGLTNLDEFQNNTDPAPTSDL